MVGLSPPKVYWFERHGFKIYSFENQQKFMLWNGRVVNKEICSLEISG